jgi:NAD(P)-dependent dehydrogenase (short-subunit alcohol dehydrogenase family)
MMELEGKAALVTGGASGIGAAVVNVLRHAGVRVASLDIDVNESEGDLNIACDVSREEQVVSAVAEAVDTLGGLDLAFVNAGVVGRAPILELDMAEWDRLVDVNLRGAVMTIRETARAIRDAGSGGAIVATASSAALVVDMGISHYNASKIGLVHVVRTAARELGPHGIRVNAVAPGPTITPLQAPANDIPGFIDRIVDRTALGRLGEPLDIAEVVLSLFQLEWVTGQTIACDGGLTLYSPTTVEDLL